MATNDLRPRYQPCCTLYDNGIPCVVWFEDAIAHYGVPTVLFDLYILVPDVETAAQVLVQDGWKFVSQEKGKIGNATVNQPQRRLAPPSPDVHEEERPKAELSTSHSHTSMPPPPSSKPPGPTTTVLLPAADWNFSLAGYDTNNTKPLGSIVFPPIAGLLDALIDSLLDCPSDNGTLRTHLSLQVAYLYGWAPVLQEPALAEHLMYEHRQYHFDVLSGMSYGTVPFIAHQRNIREALRQKTQDLQECSARDNKNLFSGEIEAQLLASMSNPFPETGEDWEVEDDW